MKDSGKLKAKRWKNIKAWIKLAKDGRLYQYPVLLLPGQEDYLDAQNPENWDPDELYDELFNPGGCL
jgi:hypothetical protein